MSEVDPDLAARLQLVREKEEKRQKLRKQIIRERRVLLPILAIALLALPNFRMGKVQGRSMEPLLHDKDSLVILQTYRYFSPLHVGDIVVIRLAAGKLKGVEIVKRIVFIQNDQGNAPFPATIHNSRGTYRFADAFPAVVSDARPVPARWVLVLGDNVNNSTDSRDFGAIRTDEIIGKVIH